MIAAYASLRHSPSLAEVAWPWERVAEAMEVLARAAKLEVTAVPGQTPAPPAGMLDDVDLRSEWLERLGTWLGVEAVPIDEAYPHVRRLITHCAPALLLVHVEGVERVIAVVAGGAARVTVLDPHGNRHELAVDLLHHALTEPLAAPLREELDAFLESAGVSVQRRARAREVLLDERLATDRVSACWVLRAAGDGSFASELRAARLVPSLARLLVAHLCEYALLLFAWEAAAQGALLGIVDRGWLAAWFLALVSAVPFQLATSWLSSRLAVDAGAVLRSRLLAGILRLDPAAVRREGTGQLLGRVMESWTVESQGLSGALQAALSTIDLVAAVLLLAQGAAAGILLPALALSLCAVVAGAVVYHRMRRTWTDGRLALTHDLIERMVGQRTRIAQEPWRLWHDVEDQLLDRYLHASVRFDRTAVALTVVPRAWILLGFACLLAPLLASSPRPETLAFSIGGILVASRGMSLLVNGLSQLASAAIAWRQVAPLVNAPKTDAQAPHPTVASTARARAERSVLEAKDITIAFANRHQPVLRDASLTVHQGDRILLEGPSGSGKSTFAYMLAGFRKSERGILMFNGLDRPTLGASGWRQRVTVAPQFHHNHVLTGTFAFNILFGKRWPARPADLELAELICRDLGLGPLLDRMPSGIHQIVGETGWQLSHGERSRLYAARAILGDADLIVLDESIAALDPDTAQTVIRCARERSRALMLIAHP